MEQFFLDAWRWLTRERDTGFGLGPIRPSSIVYYGEYKGLPVEDIDLLIDVIMAMDDAFLKEKAPKDPSPKRGRRG